MKESALPISDKGVFPVALSQFGNTFAMNFIAVFPMILSVFASRGTGGTMGFLNSARFAGNAVGPLLATSVLASSNLPTLYLLISGLTLVSLFAFLRATREVCLLPPEGAL